MCAQCKSAQTFHCIFVHFDSTLSSALYCQSQMLLCKSRVRAAANQSPRASCLSVIIGRWTRLLASSFWFPVGASRCPDQRAERDVTPGVTSSESGGKEAGRKVSVVKGKCGKRNGLEKSFFLSQHETRSQSYHTGADVI